MEANKEERRGREKESWRIRRKVEEEKRKVVKSGGRGKMNGGKKERKNNRYRERRVRWKEKNQGNEIKEEKGKEKG